MHLRRVAVAVMLGLVAAAPATASPDFQISAGTSSGGFFGESIGLDFSAGRLVAAWADNSAALGGNPDPPALDIAFAGVTSGSVGANVNVTANPLSQFSASVAVDPTNPNKIVAAALAGSSEAAAFDPARVQPRRRRDVDDGGRAAGQLRKLLPVRCLRHVRELFPRARERSHLRQPAPRAST
jgi:hypothetical protein